MAWPCPGDHHVDNQSLVLERSDSACHALPQERMYASRHSNVFSSIEDEFGAETALRLQCALPSFHRLVLLLVLVLLLLLLLVRLRLHRLFERPACVPPFPPPATVRTKQCSDLAAAWRGPAGPVGSVQCY